MCVTNDAYRHAAIFPIALSWFHCARACSRSSNTAPLVGCKIGLLIFFHSDFCNIKHRWIVYFSLNPQSLSPTHSKIQSILQKIDTPKKIWTNILILCGENIVFVIVGLELGKGTDCHAKCHECYGIQLSIFQALQTRIPFAQIVDWFIFFGHYSPRLIFYFWILPGVSKKTYFSCFFGKCKNCRFFVILTIFIHFELPDKNELLPYIRFANTN